MRTLLERFEEKYIPEPNSGCYLWIGAKARRGYGVIRVSASKSAVMAHRVAYELYKGPIPENLCVLHKCDTPACVNSDHLWLGTNADNSADMVQKGRSAKGEICGKSKLSEKQVLEIRKASGLHREIAVRYDIHRSNVGFIKSRKTWVHL